MYQMNRNFRIIAGILLLLVSYPATSQDFMKEIRDALSRKGIDSILSFNSLTRFSGKDAKEMYSITVDSNLTLIYNRDADMLEKDSLLYYDEGVQTFVGGNDQHWFLFNDQLIQSYGWKPVVIEKDLYDRVEIPDYSYFIGFKGSRKWLFWFTKDYDQIIEPQEIHFAGTDYYGYRGGLIVRVSDSGKQVYKYVQYARPYVYDTVTNACLPDPNFRFLQADEKFLADSLITWPDDFVSNCLIKLDGEYHVYSFSSDKIIEKGVRQFYQVPMLCCPLIIMNDYIGFGRYEWTRIPLKEAESVDFFAVGDFVYGYIRLRDGSHRILDFQEENIVEEDPIAGCSCSQR